jgi:Zn-dependent peptidase ImmA (M78 family)
MPQSQVNRVAAVAEASRLWRVYSFRSPRDLVLEDLALALGVVVLEGRLDSADAWLIRSGKRGLVRVKADIPEPGRKRFAIAHELGHWQLHQKVSQVLACTNEDMREQYKGSAPEIEANFFAAELLMPESHFAPRIKSGTFSPALLRDLAREFQTTLTAAAVRYAELTDDYCAVVISQNGRIRWWRGSARFIELLWIDSSQPLSANTVAGSVFAGESPPQSPEEVDVSAWGEVRGKLESEVLWEAVIPLPAYDQVLSLLSLA